MTLPSAAAIRRAIRAHWLAVWPLAAKLSDVHSDDDRALYAAFGLTERPTPTRPTKSTKRRKRHAR